MVRFLILNIANHIAHLAFRIRERAVAFLPRKWMGTQILRFDLFAAFGFYIWINDDTDWCGRIPMKIWIWSGILLI